MANIPHIIHYCWFGNPKKPKSVQKYIDNWHKMLPDYEFMEWNESNCDLEHEIVYVQEAYHCKKYAFVSDYIRIKKLNEYGGVYFDTDVKVLRSFDKYLENAQVVLGFQGVGNLGTAFIATVAHHPLFEKFLEKYVIRHFIQEDGSMDQTSINVSLDPLVEACGLDLYNDSYQVLNEGIVVYPTEYFCAFDIENWHPVITGNSCTVHYMESSWRSNKIRAKILLLRVIFRLIGTKNYDRIRALIKRKELS